MVEAAAEAAVNTKPAHRQTPSALVLICTTFSLGCDEPRSFVSLKNWHTAQGMQSFEVRQWRWGLSGVVMWR